MQPIKKNARYEVQEFDGGWAGFLVVEDIHPKKGIELISCHKITKTVGDKGLAARNLDLFVQFNIKQ